MTDTLLPRVADLLTQSLSLWGVAGRVGSGAGERIEIAAAGKSLAVRRADPGAPFRWTIETPGRRRHALSVHGVLKVVRSELDPAYEPGRLRVAAGARGQA